MMLEWAAVKTGKWNREKGEMGERRAKREGVRHRTFNPSTIV